MFKHILPIAQDADVIVLHGKTRVGKSTLAKKIGETYTISKTYDAVRGAKELGLSYDDKLAIRSKNYPTIIFDEVHHFERSEASIQALVDGIELALENDKQVVLCTQVLDILKTIDLSQLATKKDKQLVTITLEGWCVDRAQQKGFKIAYQEVR